MTIGARTAAWSGEKLPYLRRVEYLEGGGNGGSGLYTGFLWSMNDVYEIDFVPEEWGAWGVFFGTFGIDKPYDEVQFGTSNKKTGFSWRYDTGNNSDTRGEVVAGTRYKCLLQDGSFTITDPDATNTYTYTKYSGWAPTTVGEDVQLFRLLTGSNLQWRYSKMKLYSFKATNATQTVDLIPVVADFGSGEEGCLYDRAAKRLIRNAGTGAFTWGELA